MDFDIKKYNYTQPWFDDSEIKNNLLKHINKNKKINMLEIGCFEGLSSSTFSDNLLNNKDSTLDCVDPYIESGTDPEITTTCVNENVKKRFLYNISKSNNYSKINFHQMKSDNFFKNNKKTFNLIYIDGCHEEKFITNDMENSFKFLEKGGILWMDDYGGNTKFSGKIKPVMDRFLEKYKNNIKIINKGYQLAIIKI